MVCHQSSWSPSSPNLGRLLLDHKRGLDQGVKEDVQPVRKLWQDVHTCLLKNANTKTNTHTDRNNMQLVITMHIICKYKCSDWYCKNWPGLGCLDPRESSPAAESVADSTRWSRPGLRTWQFDNIEIIDSYLFFGNHFVFLNVTAGALEIMNLQRSTT